MGNGKNHSIGPFVDRCVIYYETHDKCWVAHSLRTDQIGAGDCVVDALTALLRAVDFVLKDAAQDHTLAVFREAPKDIQDIANSAETLPREVFEIAHKMVRGKWPQSLPLCLEPDLGQTYTTNIREKSVAV